MYLPDLTTRASFEAIDSLDLAALDFFVEDIIVDRKTFVVDTASWGVELGSSRNKVQAPI